MSDIAARLQRALTLAGHAVVAVSIPDPTTTATWTVQPSSLQAAVQPIIDAFNAADPVHVEREDDAHADIHHRHKDLLATCAVILEKTDANWATYTNAQKRTAVVACAKRWEQQRNWVTRNYQFMTF
jgi:hypothetical protein